SKKTMKLLVINPNTTTIMTDSLRPVVDAILSRRGYPQVSCDFFTAPTPPSEDTFGALPSINSPSESALSATYCFPFLTPFIRNRSYDGFLVACYSHHPLVSMLSDEIARVEGHLKEDSFARNMYVTGIFEASIIASFGLLSQASRDSSFGIVSTGRIWESALSDAVGEFLGSQSSRFAGCETTGLIATELHDLPTEDVCARMADAAARLVGRGRVRVICLGCAGMVGLEGAVREGVVRVLGEEEGANVRIVDGVVAGIQWLIQAKISWP
ncbi:hypothetical protein OF83DRAFT_1068669, partial [Amylostereum chailletii]